MDIIFYYLFKLQIYSEILWNKLKHLKGGDLMADKKPTKKQKKVAPGKGRRQKTFTEEPKRNKKQK